MTKREKLQELIDKKIEENPEYYHLYVEYVPFDGWYAIPIEIRWFGDKGEYLGSNYDSAVKTINYLLS